MVTEEEFHKAIAVVDRVQRSRAVLRLCMSRSNTANNDMVDTESICITADYANPDNTIGFLIRFQHDVEKTNMHDVAEYMEYVDIPVTEVVMAMNEEEMDHD